MIESYLPFLLWYILLAGLFLAFLRPYASFLLVICILVSFSTGELANIRTIFGPYFNILDASLFIALVAMMADKRILLKFKLAVPNAVFFMSTVLLIGTLISLFKLGFTYETIRAFRWALSFILFFLISSNMVTNEVRAKAIVVVLFIGSIGGSLRSIFFVASNIGTYMLSLHYSIIRTVKYCKMEHIFLLFMAIWPLPKKWWRKVAYFVAGVFFVLSLGFSQTRSVWFALILSAPFIMAIYSRRKAALLKNLFILGTCGVLAIWFCNLLFGLNFIGLITNRIVEMTSSLASMGAYGTSGSRMLAFKKELNAWLDSNIVFGKGLCYFQKEYGQGIAYNHLGYLTYLAQLGLLGFIVYGLYVPISVIQNSIKVYKYKKERDIKLFAVFSGCAMVYLSIGFLMTGSFLCHACIPGILAGGTWALSRRINLKLKTHIIQSRLLLPVSKRRHKTQLGNKHSIGAVGETQS